MSNESNLHQIQETGRIKVKGSLLDRAKKDDREAMETIFGQFVPQDEKIRFAEYYGFTGFWFVGYHSFACLTDKRMASLEVGPFKKIVYKDGYFENMTSGEVRQPTLFWLRVYQVFAFLLGLPFLALAIATGIAWVASEVFGLFAFPTQAVPLIVGSIGAIMLIPFVMNFVTVLFYRINPSGLLCWVRERKPVVVSVSRDRMLKANRLFRLWSNLRDERLRAIKRKLKSSSIAEYA